MTYLLLVPVEKRLLLLTAEESALWLLLPTTLDALKAETPPPTPLLDAATAAARHAREAIFFVRLFRVVVVCVIIFYRISLLQWELLFATYANTLATDTSTAVKVISRSSIVRRRW